MTTAVIIPARNEAENLPTLLGSLAAQDRPPEQVIVVDDHSSDTTHAVATRFGVDVISAPPLPPGWTGKAWACWTGARATTASRIVFLDADVRLAPDALQRLSATHAGCGGFLSVQPFAETERVYEAASLFFNVVGVIASRAFGPCVAVDRDDYFEVGGHAAVRGDVAEDLALADAFRRAHKPVHACIGGSTIRFRMYPHGMRQLIEGWAKNFATGARRTRLPILAAVSVWIAIGIVATSKLLQGQPLSYALYALTLAWLARRVGDFRLWVSAVYPCALACFLGVFAWSLLATFVRHEVSWRGRRITVKS